jgi:hypothetical protein
MSIFGMGLVFCATPSHSFSAPSLSISIALPAAALDTTDLDLRDAQNRPIHSAAVRETFEQLWIKSLKKMLLNSLTPLHVQLMSLLNSSWDGFAGTIRNILSHSSRFLKAVLNAVKKKESIHWRSLGVQKNVLSSDFIFCAGNSFLYFIHSVISSTRLLR